MIDSTIIFFFGLVPLVDSDYEGICKPPIWFIYKYSISILVMFDLIIIFCLLVCSCSRQRLRGDM